MHGFQFSKRLPDYFPLSDFEVKKREDPIYGYSDHLHCLFLLNRDQSISKVAQLIKGESAFWINKNKLLRDHFKWQDDY